MPTLKIIRSLWDLIKYIYLELDRERGFILIVSISSVLVSFIAQLIEPNTIFFRTLTFIFIAISISLILKDFFVPYNIVLSWDAPLKQELSSLKPSIDEEQDGFDIISDPYVTDSAIAYSKSFNNFLLNNQNDIEISLNKEYRERLLRQLRAEKDKLVQILLWKWCESFKSGSLLINESKVSVASPIRTNIAKITLFKGDYFSSFLTNELSLFKIHRQGASRRSFFYDGSRKFPRIIVEGIERLQEFNEYVFGNHIGASTIAVSSDKYLSLWVQNKKAQQSVGLFAPTGSGSLDWNDINNTTSLKKAVVTGMNREFHEESNRRGQKLSASQIEETLLIGYFRRLARGGKPEFVAISRLAVSHIELEPNLEEVEDISNARTVEMMNHYPVKTFTQLQLTVRDLLESNANKRQLSVPLWANLLALNDVINSQPNLVKNFFRL
jgi:hypothetical protein